MYKLSVPISYPTVNDETLPVYLDYFRKCGAERVFLCAVGLVYNEDTVVKTEPLRLRRVIEYFQQNGLEVGIWISAFGHGGALAFDELPTVSRYTSIEDVRGDRSAHAICPLDPDFRADYADGIQRIAALGPDLIMLDDDFRINHRQPYYHLGCFCPRHLKDFYARIGEELPRDEIEEKILCGGKNKYRDAYLDATADSMLGFARMLREALDAVDPSIRLGFCTTLETWDLYGTDVIELARAFAGGTKPFARISGAPYWNPDVIPVIELSRQQYAWGKDSGVELFSEGDTYPRPRYLVPSKPLELFDLALIACGEGDGALNYLFAYCFEPGYETGYVDRYLKNAPVRDAVRRIFGGKHPVGVRVLNYQRKLRDWKLPERLPDGLFDALHRASFSPAGALLSRNAIPTAFAPTDSPALLIGENARYAALEDLQNGVVLDTVAAKILQERGIDVGWKGAQSAKFSTEYFPAAEETSPVEDARGGIQSLALQRLECAPEARVLSTFLPDRTPAAYCYENAEGLRVFVLALDFYASHPKDVRISYMHESRSYWNSYLRQAQLTDALAWLGRKPLPATCAKNPNLYLLAARGGDAMSVALCNVFPDDVLAPCIQLDRAYTEIEFVNCEGRLEGDRVILSDLAPYGFAAFEGR